MAIIALTGNSIFGVIPQFPVCAVLIAPHDTDEFEHPVAVRCDAAGAVTVEPYGTPGATVTFTVLAGEVLPVMVRKVLDTGTDPITLHALY